MIGTMIAIICLADIFCWCKSDYPPTDEWLALSFVPGSGFVALWLFGLRHRDD